jgi:hypothetical protein
MRKIIRAVQEAGTKKGDKWRVDFGVLNAKSGDQFEVRNGEGRTLASLSSRDF